MEKGIKAILAQSNCEMHAYKYNSKFREKRASVEA